VSSKVAVIVETRKHKALDFVLNNFISNLPADWKIQIFHGSENFDYLQNIVEKIKDKDRIIFTDLNVKDMYHDDYVDMFTKEKFWSLCEGDIILTFQVDTMLCSNSKFKVSDFEHHDYIGGYWGTKIYPLNEEHHVVMNGGLSIRNKKAIIESIRNKKEEYLKNGGNPCEDYLFSTCIENKPTTGDVLKFSIDNGYVSPLNMEAPFGVHQPWSNKGGAYDDIKNVCDGVETLSSLQYVEIEKQWWEE
jgi:hypothetical protein